MWGLQGIIPGRRSNVEVTPVVAGGTKVSMSIAAARKELKGQRKNPPEKCRLLKTTHRLQFSQ
jgi:hypothetical protein